MPRKLCRKIHDAGWALGMNDTANLGKVAPDASPSPTLQRTLYVELGDRIRQIRSMRGLRQSELASRAGVTFQQIQKYERGQNRVPLLALLDIAEILRVELRDLVEGLPHPSLGGSHQQANEAVPIEEKIQLIEAYARLPDRQTRLDLVTFVASLANAHHGR